MNVSVGRSRIFRALYQIGVARLPNLWQQLIERSEARLREDQLPVPRHLIPQRTRVFSQAASHERQMDL